MRGRDRTKDRTVDTDFVTGFERNLDRDFVRDFVTGLDRDFERVFDMGFVRALDTVPQTGESAGEGADFGRKSWPLVPRTGIYVVRIDTFRPN